MKLLCDVCGNENSITTINCIYCCSKLKGEAQRRSQSLSYKIINIEQGKPFVEDALAKFYQEIVQAKSENIAVVIIIHGYGSSGKGGAIRTECRKILEYMQSNNTIRGFILGENFSQKNGQTRALLRRIPNLAHNDNLNRRNKGATIVEL